MRRLRVVLKLLDRRLQFSCFPIRKFRKLDNKVLTVDPRPVTISVNFMNTDWAKKNPEVAANYYLAYMRGVRDWCQGYHGAPVRQEIIELLIKTKVETRPEILNGFWTARPIDGRVGVASLLDVQEFYLKQKMISKKFPSEKLVDNSWGDTAACSRSPSVR